MPYINFAEREIAFKVVYYGPGMSGKTTNLLHLHNTLAAGVRGDLVSLDTAEERTIFFDYLPVELGQIDGFTLRFNMYTIPGQVCYESSRRLILDGADGVVFVADSQVDRYRRNVESFRAMEANLRSYDLAPENFPLVLQYNKRDCPDAIPLGSVERELGLESIPAFEAVAIRGIGVMETVHELTRDLVQNFQL